MVGLGCLRIYGALTRFQLYRNLEQSLDALLICEIQVEIKTLLDYAMQYFKTKSAKCTPVE